MRSPLTSLCGPKDEVGSGEEEEGEESDTKVGGEVARVIVRDPWGHGDVPRGVLGLSRVLLSLPLAAEALVEAGDTERDVQVRGYCTFLTWRFGKRDDPA